MAKGPFKLRSQSVVKKSGFKAMGSSPNKQTIKTSGQFGFGEKPTSEFQKLSDWEDQAKTEKTAKEVQAVVAKTDKDVSASEKSILDRDKLKHEQEKLAFRKQVHEESKESKKTGPSMDQQLADRKLKDLEKEQLRLGEKGHSKGWSDKKLARKEKRLNKKIAKAKKMTDPTHRYERDLDHAKAKDIMRAGFNDPNVIARSGSLTPHQDALKKGFDYTQTTQDVETAKNAGQTINATDTFTNSGGYTSSGEDIMGEKLTSTDVTGKYDSEGNFLRDDE